MIEIRDQMSKSSNCSEGTKSLDGDDNRMAVSVASAADSFPIHIGGSIEATTNPQLLLSGDPQPKAHQSHILSRTLKLCTYSFSNSGCRAMLSY